MFTETFYTQILKHGATVCQAFTTSIKNLNAKYYDEADKFKMYGPKPDDGEGVHEEGKCDVMKKFKKGEPKFVQKKTLLED
jgi:hypothetical protein